MRIPTALTKCKVTSITAIAVMVIGSITDHQWMRGWSLLLAVYAVGLCLRTAIERGAGHVKAYVKVWSLDTFESGFKQGVEQGREMEAAERFIAGSRHHN